MNSQTQSLYDIARMELDKIKSSNRSFVIIITLVVLGTFFDAIEQYNAGYAAASVSKLFGIPALTISTQVEFTTFAFMALGGLLAGFMGDYLGRRFLYSFNLLIYAVGALISALSVNYPMFLAGRAVVGIGLGGEISTGLALISELVPVRIRGQYTGLVNVGPGFGIFAVAALALIFLGPYSSFFGGPLLSWRWFLGVLVIPALLVFFYRRYIPETPRFLISKGKSAEAFAVIKMLSEGRLLPMSKVLSHYDKSKLEEEFGFSQLKPIYEKPKLADLFGGIYLKRTILLTVLSFITFGVTAALTISYPFIYSTASQALHLSSTFILVTITNFATLLGTIVASVLGRFNRRVILPLLGGLAAVFISLITVSTGAVYLLILSLFLYNICGYASNTSVWLYSPELYPTRARNLGTGLVLVTSLLGVAVMILVVSTIYSTYGLVGLGILGGVLYAVYTISQIMLGEETVNKDLEVISP